MDFNNNNQTYRAKIDDDNDSFHSFAQSDRDASDLGSLTDVENSIKESTKVEFEKNAFKKLKTSVQSDYSISKSTDTCSLDANASSVSPNKYQSPKSEPLRKSLGKGHYQMSQLKSNSEMPDMDLFNMNITPSTKKDSMNVNGDTETLQKYAFTKIWLAEQQNNQAEKRSMHGEFTAALDDYFHKKRGNQSESMTETEEVDREKDKGNRQLFVKQSQTSSAPSASFPTVSESPPYVSPFEDMPTVCEGKRLTGPNAYITVPAGFDLSNLVEYKNPNHWHRRRTTRNDYHP